MIHNSPEWDHKMAAARRLAGERNGRMLVTGYRMADGWHYIIVPSLPNRSRARARRRTS